MTKPSWVKGITLHHTGAPSLSTRPHGLTAQHIENIQNFYRNEMGWKGGPHLFVDDDQIWGMNEFSVPGVHAVSFNRTHIGIEVLGDFDSEDPLTGRGFECWMSALSATRNLLDWLSLPVSSVNFHRDDPKTKKSCPGRKVTKEWVHGILSNSIIQTAPKQEEFTISLGGQPFDSRVANAGVVFVPVRVYLSRILGVPLESVKGLTFDGVFAEYNGIDIEKAIMRDNVAYAPLREVCSLVGAQVSVRGRLIDISVKQEGQK
jgi:hypothetical protein